MTAQPSLRLLPGGHSTVRPERRCQIAAQAVMAGVQDWRVSAQTAQASGRGHGVISIRVGRVLIYLEDTDALDCWATALQRAVELREGAYGPENHRYEPKYVK